MARRHGHAHGAVAQTQDLLDHLLLFRLNQTRRGAFGQNALDLFLSDVRTVAVLDAHDLEDARGRGRQQQDEGLHRQGHGRDRRRHFRGDGLGEDQGQALGHQFADDQRDIGDQHDHQGRRGDLGIGGEGREAGFQDAIQLARDGRLTIGARQNADQGDADLNRRQELCRLLRQLEGSTRPAIPAFGTAL
ncbi:hypothetical protein D3C80_1484390 [compost metagenome]